LEEIEAQYGPGMDRVKRSTVYKSFEDKNSIDMDSNTNGFYLGDARLQKNYENNGYSWTLTDVQHKIDSSTYYAFRCYSMRRSDYLEKLENEFKPMLSKKLEACSNDDI